MNTYFAEESSLSLPLMEPYIEAIVPSADSLLCKDEEEASRCCCFTGHRPIRLPWISNEADKRCIALKERIAIALHEIYTKGFRHFICGMAIGCDMYFAEAVLALRDDHSDVILEAAIPCDGQAERWTRNQQERYVNLIGKCDLVTYVSHVYSPDCMMRRNEYMVDHAAMLLACFNGTSGGTMKTILYAQRKGVPTVIIDIDE